MKQYALFFIKQNERFVVKLYEPENITRLKQMLMLDENNYCWQMGGYIVHDIAGCLNIIYKCFVKCEVIYE